MKHSLLIGVSVLPALFIMPAFSDTLTTRQVITENTTYTDLIASNIASTTANNGGVFYMQDVPNVVLDFDGVTQFRNNSLNNGGMGGVIGNGWLSSTSGSGYTVGGKIVFNDAVTFADNSTNNTNGGGAIFNYGNGTATSPDIIFYGDATFSGNQATAPSPSVYVGGGAIHHNNGMIVFNGNAAFDANSSASQGGAIMSAGDMIFNGAASFANNTAGTNGGALAIMAGHTTFADVATFSDNSAAGASAVYLGEAASALTFADTVSFSENTGVGTLLNNSTTATVSFANGASFTGNTNTLNGALVNRGTLDVTSGDLIFASNTGSNGGGLKSSGTVNVNTSGDVTFSQNTTTNSAGAYDNGGTARFTANAISFTDNTADAGYGGAIFNAGDLTLLGATNVFSGNTASDSGATKSGGGAIHNRGNTGTSSLIIGTSASTNTFASNTSNAYGGAIVSRAYDGADQDASIVINGTTNFTNNVAALDGGAIWNAVTESDGTTGTSSIVFNGDTTFANNISGGMGGALYNNDTVTFNGKTVFSNNTANGVANDIHNDGNVTFNGDTTVAGGITGTGTLTVSDGATLNIGTSSVSQGSVVLDGTMLATLRSGDTAQINVTNPDGFSGTGILRLSFDGAGTYRVFGDQSFNNLDISSSVYDLTWNGGDVTATIKSVADIASENNLSDTAARTVANTTQSTSPQLNNLSVLMQESLASGSATGRSAVEHAAHAIGPETAAVPQSVGTSVQNTLAKIIASRMSSADLYGRSGGDVSVSLGNLWAQGIYNKSKLNDTFNGYTRAASVGFDGVINDTVTIGMGYMFGHSDIGGIARNTEVDSHSIFAYGQYRPGNWYMNAILNYTMSDYAESGDAMGLNVSADYDLDTFGAGLSMGYDFFGGITPELSVRYMHLGSADYTNSLGIRNRHDSSDFLTASLGTRYGFDLFFTNGWRMRPDMHYAIKYDLISDDNNIIVTMPGINSYTLAGERLSRIGGEVGIGINMIYGAFAMSLHYDIEMRTDYTSQTGRVKFKYDF